MTKKYIILNDVHFGVRNGLQIFMDYQSKVYDYIIDFAIHGGVTDIIILGDIFDKRKTVDFGVLGFTLSVFERFRKAGIHITISLGNHDVYYKDTNRINSPKMLLSHLPNVTVLEKCCTLEGHSNIGIVPWICEENSDECFDFIKNNKFDSLLGHFEISGFVMHKGGITINHGLKQDIFAHHKNVYSGHYHYKSQIGNISYLGSQFQFTWADADDVKYFHIMDGDTGVMRPIEIPFHMFTVLKEVPDDVHAYEGMQIRIMTNEDVDPETIAELTDNAHDVKVIRKSKPVEDSEDVSEDYDITDKLTMAKEYASTNGLGDKGMEKFVNIFMRASES